MALCIVNNRANQQNGDRFRRSEHVRTSSQLDLQSYIHTIYTALRVPGRSDDSAFLSAASVDVTPVGRDHRFLRLLPAPLQLGPDRGRRVAHSSVAAFVFWLWILLKNLVVATVPHTHRTQALICNHANNRHAWCLSEPSVPDLETETA